MRFDDAREKGVNDNTLVSITHRNESCIMYVQYATQVAHDTCLSKDELWLFRLSEPSGRH